MEMFIHIKKYLGIFKEKREYKLQTKTFFFFFFKIALCFQTYSLFATNQDRYVNRGPNHQVLRHTLVNHQLIRIW